ncbi:unnamed protein product [Durusdinium trenchii]|uniref:Uncharacterized protein n=2 Tax=Durusdinium trenchii TaxID=1381693 RepID=A0ABP0QYV9_9DINO
MEVVRSLPGDLYHIFPLYVDMGDCGHAGATRRRVYVILAHKHMTDMITNPYNLYQNVVLDLRLKSEALDCQTTPGDYLTADHMEIQLDAMEVARSSGKPFRSNLADLSYLLSDREQEAASQLSQYYVQRLTVLSFPIRGPMSSAIGCEPLGVRDPKRAAQLVGNAMAFGSVTLVVLVALSSFKMKPSYLVAHLPPDVSDMTTMTGLAAASH